MKHKLYRIFLLAVLTLLSAISFAQTPTVNLTVSGLKESVTVRRDERGIPYIEARNSADLCFAQGYVMAQDRLWQMDLLRRVARGETAEIFGKVALEQDKRWRRFGFAGVVEETFKNFNPEHRIILESYARGVNAYIATLGRDKLPAEFQILQYSPTPWKPSDSLIIGAILADGLSTTWTADVMRAAFLDLSKDKFKELFIEKTPYDVLVVGKDTEEVKSKKEKVKSEIKIDDSLADFALKDEEIRKSSLELAGFYSEFNAMSNNWVVSGKRTLDGKPILANDPHLPPTAPSIWYLAHLSSPDVRVSGVTLPGVPGIVLGHNEYIAWGATNLNPDVQDVYLETFNGQNQYKTPAGWENPRTRKEEIKVRKSVTSTEIETVSFDVTETRHGVINYEDGGKKYALKWTALDPKNNTFGAFLNLNRAKNWNEFKAALKSYGGATQNFIFADVKGNIGYYGAGVIPIRRKGDGSLPYDGSTNDGDWIGNIPFEELPNKFNPPEGFIVTANQRVTGDSYKYFLSHVWSSPYRALRIQKLLEGNKKLTVSDVMDIQRDVFNISFSNFAREIVKSEAASAETLQVLRGWDGQMKADSQAALLLYEIRTVFLNKVLAANVGADRVAKYRWSMQASFVDWLAETRPANWLPKEFADYKSLFIASDKAAREAIAKRYGSDTTKWTWGSSGRFTFPHPLGLANIPFISAPFQIEPFPRYGSGQTPNVGESVSMRHVTVPGSWDLTRQGIALGESGDPQSPHWKDQLEFWKAGRTQVFPFSKEAVEKAVKETVVLTPKQ
jgi:penicillin amidase